MINWEKYFDHIVILSGTQNFEKRKILDEEFKRIGLTNYQYFYNCQNCLINFKYYSQLNIGISGIFATFGHYTIIKTAYELGWDNILLFEDDIKFLKNLNNIKKQLNIFNKIKSKTNIYMFDYFTLNILITYFSAVYLDRKGMEYIIYCIEHYPCIVDTFAVNSLLHENNKKSILWFYRYKDKTIKVEIPETANVLPIIIEKSPIRLCIQDNEKNYKEYDIDIDKCNYKLYNVNRI